MRNRLALVALACLAAIPVVSGTAQAEGATVITDFGCTLIPADSGIADPLFTTDSHVVQTPSGNVSLTCHFTIPPELVPASTMQHAGFLCGTQFGVTTNTKSVTTAGGTAMLRCQIKP